MLVGQERVLRLAGADLGEIVRERRLEELGRTRPLDLELTHVGDVEHTTIGADRLVFGDDAFVLHGHLPAGERHHPRAESDMHVV